MITEKQLNQRLQRAPRALPPDHDLWPGIEQRIAPQRQRSPLWPLAAVAATVAVMATALWQATDQPGAQTPSAADVRDAPSSGAGLRLASQVDLQYSGALKNLARSVDPATLPPEDGELTLSLRTLQRATEDIRAALEQDPEAVFLADLLEQTHRQRIRLLKDRAMANPGPDTVRRT